MVERNVVVIKESITCYWLESSSSKYRQCEMDFVQSRLGLGIKVLQRRFFKIIEILCYPMREIFSMPWPMKFVRHFLNDYFSVSLIQQILPRKLWIFLSSFVHFEPNG
ncbi:hypothetical protein CDAR_583401 [Caerostris darwini]|uniref:Uncharacterized protein n=1 Tax=Caerostris darwini TaxID=1538125 RepID=A0AAV4V8X5_9ARAC|nr:hypothetical protein CDAR_583401 [Caerostris darwini]